MHRFLLTFLQVSGCRSQGSLDRLWLYMKPSSTWACQFPASTSRSASWPCWRAFSGFVARPHRRLLPQHGSCMANSQMYTYWFSPKPQAVKKRPIVLHALRISTSSFPRKMLGVIVTARLQYSQQCIVSHGTAGRNSLRCCIPGAGDKKIARAAPSLWLRAWKPEDRAADAIIVSGQMVFLNTYLYQI